VAAFTVPAYSGASPSQTLVQVNGNKVALIVAVPLLGAIAVFTNLVIRRRRRRPGVGIFTWVVIGMLGIFMVLGLATIGMFVAPVLVCLLVAAMRIQEAGTA
jgi:predicted membrane channel-forming protein YqfA (hemolysin III family)